MGNNDYYIDGDGFVIEGYNQKKPFSSFLPAVSGLYGKPLWAYYVNRGQCMAAFGVDNKDCAIMEFLPANKAYRQTALQGFRTFYKVKKADGPTQYYEPFQNSVLSQSDGVSQKMRVTSYDFKIEDNNAELGIRTEAMFCTLAEEEIPGLVRTLTITNTSGEEVLVEVMDGLPVIIPYYLINHDMKNESNLRQAWMSADLVDGVPFYRIKALPYDTAETVLLEGGNFYLNFGFEGGRLVCSEAVTDPTLVFGDVTDFTSPQAFLEEGYKVPAGQVSAGYTPCGFGHKVISLKPGESNISYTLIGSAPGLGQFQQFVRKKIKPGYMEGKIARNRELIERTKRHAFTSSNSREFDLYMGQTFMDNYLRGGYPVQTGDGKHVMYVYSRKHGDLEREYNFFQIDSTNYSQGNSNYRDVNQNRRNDVYFFPFTGKAGLRTFFDLLQLDGFNPLVLCGSRFWAEDSGVCRQITEKYFGPGKAQEVGKIFDGAFTPGKLLMALEQAQAQVAQGTLEEYVNSLLAHCSKEECAVFQEGYWADHWTYNTDLLEQYLAVYPEQAGEVFFEDASYTYYDNDTFVVPRSRRYVLADIGVRQYGALDTCPEKTAMMENRSSFPNKVRTGHGAGEIYHCTLASKVLLLLTNKIASLDPAGIGLEMEGGKPGWCDALNGQPGLIGSSINESAEVGRLAKLMLGLLGQGGCEREVLLPVEAYIFWEKIHTLLTSGCPEMEYWERSNDAKEEFRESVLYGIEGKERAVSGEEAASFLQAVAQHVEEGLKKAYNPQTGVYDTYFINEAVEYEVQKDEGGSIRTGFGGLPLVKVARFSTRAVPPFLEGQVHMMRAKPEAAQTLHQAVKKSGLYDGKLDMFKVNADIMSETKEIGRQNVFPRGWLENEAVFLHMEYKYFLELLQNGLYGEFFHYLKTSFVPFLDAAVYGRSILENSSFIASSAHMDARIHGTGYVSRLTGASAEMLTMWRIMTVGHKPFQLDAAGRLCMALEPKLPGWLFTEEERAVSAYTENGQMEFIQPKDTFAFYLLGKTLVVYENAGRLDTYREGVGVRRVTLKQEGEPDVCIDGAVVPEEYARKARDGRYGRIDIVIGKQKEA